MKRKLLFGFLLLAYAFGNAQFQIIDDPAFEDELIRLGHDTNPVRDGGISISDAEAVTFLNLTGVDTNDVTETFTAPGLGIADLTGIKAFTNLEVLWAQQNDLVELDLEGMTTLTDVRAFNNNLARINIKGLVNLDIIGLNNNSISGVNVSTNTNLRQFDIAQNNLFYLDISGLSNLTEMNVQGNPNLSCVQVESAARATSLNGNANFRKNGATTFSNTCTPIYTQIPDRNFEQSLLDQNIDSEGGIPNGLVLTSDISNRLSLDISGQNITDLSGLEDFSSLETLDVSNNDLNALELQNLSLIEIYANECNLAGKSIRFQNDPENGGAFLTNVTTLELQNNSFGSAGSPVSFGGIPNVTYLDVSDNNFGAIQLNESTSIEVLLANNCANLTTLENLNALNNLESLGVSFSRLSVLDVDQNAQLSFLNISGNTLTSLDLSNNNLIESVYAGDNDLASISLPTTTALSELYLENNALTALNVSIADQNLFDLDATGNPNLTCIQLSDLDFAQRAWQIDAGTGYSTNCNPQPFTVTADVLGATGTTPNFEISEGETFTINFDADNMATSGAQYNPEINFSLNGTNTIEDFLINGGETIPDQVFTVSANNPDGSISVQAKTDDFLETDEVYTITINSRDNTAYTISEPVSFTITIKNIPPTEPFVVTPFLSISENTIEEGQSFRIFFEADNSQYYNNQSFDVLFDTSSSSAQFDLDYTHGDSPTSFIARYQQDAKEFLEVEVFADQEANENEGIVITLQKDPNNIYAWENAAADGTLTFSVNIEDIPIITSIPFEIETSLSSNLISNTDGSYTIDEGETFRINLEALSPVAQNYYYTVSYDIASSIGVSDDDYLLAENPNEIFAKQESNPDGFLEFTINEDLVPDSGEKLVINLKPDPLEIFSWESSNNADGSLSFEININDVPPTTNSNIVFINLYNTGALEGGLDTLKLEIYDENRLPFTNHSGFEFPIKFSNTITNSVIELDILNGFLLGEVAKPLDYAIQDGTDLANAKIVVAPNQSKGELILKYNEDSDSLRDYFSVEIELPENSPQDFRNLFTNPLQLVILDKSGQFVIDVFPRPGGNLVELPEIDGLFSADCCLTFSIEENEGFDIYIKAEKGTPLGTEYQVKYRYEGDAKEIIDFTDNINDNSIDDGRVIDNETFHNQINIRVVDDGIPNERNGQLVGEPFRMIFEPVDRTKFVINNEYFSQYTRTSFEIRIIDIIQVSKFDIVENKGIAIENPLETAEFTVGLAKENDTGNDLIINYEILVNNEDSAIPLEDYNIPGFDNNKKIQTVVISKDEQEARIVITPIDDKKVEGDETVTIKIVEGKGYSTQVPEKQIIIKSEDKAKYSASMKAGEDDESSESFDTDFAEVIIELNEIPSNEVEVFFKISDRTNQDEVIEGEGQDYLIYQEDKSTIITPNERKVVFKANTDKKKSIFIKALLDTIDEDNESLFLQLDSGVDYEPVSTSLNAEAILISATTDLNTFVPSSITLITKKPRCPGEDQKGFIEVANASGFAFNVIVKGLDNNEEDSFELGKNNETPNNKKQTKELPVGRYEVTLSFDTEKNASIPDDAIAPLFIVEIEELPALTVQEQGVNLNSKTGEFLVSGSTSYTVKANEDIYKFSFEDVKNNIISIPLNDGINDIEFLGEAICQGIVKKEILLNDIFIYPNPSESIVSIFSEAFNKSYNIYLFDIKGRLVYEFNSSEATNRIDMDVSNLQKGMYLGKIMTEYNSAIEFKLLKK